jgi:hypothetical protein
MASRAQVFVAALSFGAVLDWICCCDGRYGMASRLQDATRRGASGRCPLACALSLAPGRRGTELLMREWGLATLLVAGLTPAGAWSQSHVPIGPEFRVNTITTGDQWRPEIARTSSGGFVVVWLSSDGGGDGFFARRYDASGSPEGALEGALELPVGSGDTPRVAATTGDGFVVAWMGLTEDRTMVCVLGQQYDDSLMPLGGNFMINDYATWGIHPSIGSNDTGRFVAAWTKYEIYARRFDSAGVPLGGSFQVNSYTTGDQAWTSVALDAAGNFVVVWNRMDGGGYWDVAARRYDASAVPQGDEFLVNTYTTGGQGVPIVASHPDGRFVVVWVNREDPLRSAVWARRYDTLGVAQGQPFRVSEYRAGRGEAVGPADVAMDAAGNFVVVWTAYQSDWVPGVFGRVFDVNGVALGAEFRINSHTTRRKRGPSVAMGPDGFVVVWQSNNQDGDGEGVFGQRFGPDRIFADGFDSGSLAAW